MAAALLVALAALLFENDDFLVFLVFKNGQLDRGTLNEGCAKASVGALADHEDFVDVNRITGFRSREDVELEDITLGDGELATLCFDSGFHGKGEEPIVLAKKIKLFFADFFESIVLCSGPYL